MMLANLLLAAAVALAPQAAPVEGTVVLKWYDSSTPGFLWMPIGPECWGLRIDTGDVRFGDPDICVDRATWERTPLFSSYKTR